MKRTLAFAALLAILAPVAGVIAMACSTMPCCAEHEDRVARPMDCCQPTLCSTDAPGRQQKAADKPAPPAAVTAAAATVSVDQQPPNGPPLFESATSPPRPNSVRLALIATLLI